VLHLRVVSAQGLGHRQRSFGIGFNGAIVEVQIRYHAVNPVELRVVPVGAAVVLQEQENEQPARHAHCEADGVE